MPWCPECEAEYVPGCTICSDCRVPLVDELPKRAPASGDTGDPGGWALLLNVPSSMEADLLVARLEGEGIPALKKAQGAGQYMEVFLGNAFDINLYVPEAYLAEAQFLLGRADSVDDTHDDAPPPEAPQPAADHSPARETGRSMLLTWLAWLIIPMLLYFGKTLYEALAEFWKSLF